MDEELAELLAGRQGAAALTEAAKFDDPRSLAAAQTMRKLFPSDLAAAALSQVELRRKARTKFPEDAEELLFTPDGLEQASRATVSRWRGKAIKESGVTGVLDLGCGIGADARGFLDAGLEVIAVEKDPVTAVFARANLPGAQVLTGDAVALASELMAAHPGWAVFLDPGRRTTSGRSWRIEDLQPPWDFVLKLLDRKKHPVWVKLGPGMPREKIPQRVDSCWISESGDLVELQLRNTGELGAATGRAAALLLPGGEFLSAPWRAELLATRAGVKLGTAPLGRYIVEPNPAVSRAGLYTKLPLECWFLDNGSAYLSSNEPLISPFAQCFEVLETMPYSVKQIRAWVRENQVGILEIKKRNIDIDPAQLRKQLRPQGKNSATLILLHTPQGTKCAVVRRV